MTTLSPAEVDQFWRDGYCVARRCVDAADIDASMEDVDNSLRHHLRRLGLPIEPAGDLAAFAREPRSTSCIDESRFLPVEMAKGDVAFMTLFTVHRTGMRSNDRLRIAASWRYEDSVEPSLIARGYRFAQSRRVRPEAFSPGFPDAEGIQDLIRQRRR